MSAPAIYLTGATASGKSAVALRLAKRLGGEIISVDSMQVYRGLDIGTAKPSAAEQSGVPHHLIDVAGLDEPFDAAQFVRLAKQAEVAIRSRDARPIFCGGTGLYFRALFDGLGDSPPGDESLRAELEAAPMDGLLDELAELKVVIEGVGDLADGEIYRYIAENVLDDEIEDISKVA